MDHLPRLIAALLLLLSGIAFGATCVPHNETQYRGQSTNAQTNKTEYTAWNTTQQGACSALASLISTQGSYSEAGGAGSNYSYTTSVSGSFNTSNNMCVVTGTRTTVFTPSVGTGYTVSSNINNSYGLGTQTIAVDCQTGCFAQQGMLVGQSGTYVIDPYTGGKGKVPTALCVGGCRANLMASNGGAVFGVLNGVVRAEVPAANYAYSGGTCVDDGSGAPGNAAPDPCPAGQCRGTINGASVCVACDSTTTNDTKTVAPPGTSASAAAGSGAASAPGAVSTQDQTTCANGKCTTVRTISTTGSDGKTTTTTDGGTTEQTQGSYCGEHPSSDLCQDDKSTWNGTCASTQCTGDAVLCAIAQEQAKRYCEVLNENDGSAAGRAAAANGNAGASDHPYKNATSTSLDFNSVIDKTNIVAASCPADLSVTILGRSNVIRFSQICTPATLLGNLLVGFTALACVGIVFVRGNK